MAEPLVFFPATVQTVAYTGTAAASAAVGAQITVVRLVATTACFVFLSDAGTAATAANGVYLPAATELWLRVNTSTKLSAIQSAAGGSLYITEMTR